MKKVVKKSSTIKVFKKTEAFVKGRLTGEGTGHDWWHIERVRNNAKLICRSEEVDWDVVHLAVLLHDVGDWKVIHKDEDDYSIAEDFLKAQNVPGKIVQKVMFIIKNMSFSKSLANKKEAAPIEFYIVQDADRLDALGAIGIARAFAYGGSKSRPIYDPTKKLQKINTTKNYRQQKGSTFHHFEEKILLLKELMNTSAAKKIARQRHEYIKNYRMQFLAEWNGEK